MKTTNINTNGITQFFTKKLFARSKTNTEIKTQAAKRSGVSVG